jgi:hypothetical protein
MLKHNEEETEAVLDYGTPDYRIIKQGDYVRCAVTGDAILLKELKYWSFELQEAYRDAVVATRRHVEVNEKDSKMFE